MCVLWPVVKAPEANVICTVLFCLNSISMNSEAQVLFTLAVGALSCVKSVLWTSEADLFCCALFLGKAGVLGLQA